MKNPDIWDPFVRIFHWSLVGTYFVNMFLLEGDSLAHEWVGYTIISLIGLRLIWGFVGPKRARFSAFPPSTSAAVEHLSEIARGIVKPHSSHNPLGAIMVYNLLATLILVGTTGYMMTTITFFGYQWVEELHELLANWALFSVFAHVAGVIFESRRTKINLVNSMLVGTKKRSEKTSEK